MGSSVDFWWEYFQDICVGVCTNIYERYEFNTCAGHLKQVCFGGTDHRYLFDCVVLNVLCLRLIISVF